MSNVQVDARTCVVVCVRVQRSARDVANLVGKDNGHDDAVNRDDLAEDDAATDYKHRRTTERKVTTDLIRFFVLIRGALTPPPRMDAPVTKIPLRRAASRQA